MNSILENDIQHIAEEKWEILNIDRRCKYQ